ncbi:MAG: hypothetical protein L3J72_01005 [Thermoplasmata archaeon]|nr:hypothetical protein [Thermoplasmata archaeon]
MRFPAPLPYVYRWCTDFGADDGERADESYERRVLRQSSREVLFEDAWWTDTGWRWRRTLVALRPPDGWSADSTGNVRDAKIDYRLRTLASGGTELEIRMRRRPSLWHTEQPTRQRFESELRGLWSAFRKSLAADYARTKAGRARRTTRPRTRSR